VKIVGGRWLVVGSLLLIVVLMAREYAYFTFFDQAEGIVMAQEERPYVYRALVPAVARVLVLAGLPAETALTVMVICMAIGLLYGLIYFSRSFGRR
jgi:hypothetical protein